MARQAPAVDLEKELRIAGDTAGYAITMSQRMAKALDGGGNNESAPPHVSELARGHWLGQRDMRVHAANVMSHFTNLLIAYAVKRRKELYG